MPNPNLVVAYPNNETVETVLQNPPATMEELRSRVGVLPRDVDLFSEVKSVFEREYAESPATTSRRLLAQTNAQSHLGTNESDLGAMVDAVIRRAQSEGNRIVANAAPPDVRRMLLRLRRQTRPGAVVRAEERREARRRLSAAPA